MPSDRRLPGGATTARAPATALLALAVLVGGALAPAAAGAATDVAVVVHPSVPVDDISFAELRKILRGDRQFWKAGKKIALIVQSKDTPERQVLLDRVYGMNEAQFKQYWVAKVFRAEATEEPTVVLSNERAVELVGVIPGAVALVAADDVPEGLKVLPIDGHSPGDEDYPLR